MVQWQLADTSRSRIQSSIAITLAPRIHRKSQPTAHAPCKEWEGAVQFLVWLRGQLVACGRPQQRILFVGDGHYDNLKLWQALPDHVILLARSAKTVRYIIYQANKQAVGGGENMVNGLLHPNRFGGHEMVGENARLQFVAKTVICKSKYKALTCVKVPHSVN